MNLVKILYDGLEKDYQDASIIEKMFYIVKTMCEYFQFDSRWWWSNDDDELEQKIFNYELNVYDVKSRKVVCSSFSKAYCEVANILLFNDENYVLSKIQEGEMHMYSQTYLKDGTVILVDPLRFTNDFLNLKKELPFRAFEIVSTNNSYYQKEEQKLKLKYTYNSLYLQYLKLVRKEICLGQNLSVKKKNEIFKFIINHTNFNNLGLKEASDLVLYSLTQITSETSGQLGFKRHILYNLDNSEIKVVYQVPKNKKKDEFYCMYEKDDKIIIDYLKPGKLKSISKCCCKNNTLKKALEKNV